MAIRFERALRGEIDGNVDPREYGFDVVEDELPSEEELDRRAIALYEYSRDLTGVTSPRLEQLAARYQEADTTQADGPADNTAEDGR